MNRILIIQTAFLGDVILATPVVSELKRLFPEAQIDFLVKKGNEQLLDNNPKLNAVLTFDKSNGKWSSLRKLLKQIRNTNYDLVVNLHRFGSSGILAGLSGAKEKIGFRKNPFSFLYTRKFDHQIGDGTHEVTRNLSLIASYGAEKIVRPELFPSAADLEKVSIFQGKAFVCIAPASVWFTKQLPESKWVELVQAHSETPVFALGAPSDFELCERIGTVSGHESFQNLSGQLSLLQSAALMQKAVRNFVNDSGPLHLASAVNAPVTAFFCSTVPDFGFGPLSDDREIRQVGPLECRPCGIHGHKSCPEGHFKCGLNQKVD